MARHQPASLETWVDVRAGAQHAHLSVWSLYDAIASKELRHVRVGGRRRIRTKRCWIDQWLQRHTVGPR